MSSEFMKNTGYKEICFTKRTYDKIHLLALYPLGSDRCDFAEFYTGHIATCETFPDFPLAESPQNLI
ncbi:unnamed protein product, partial [Adineta ricciae]